MNDLAAPEAKPWQNLSLWDIVYKKALDGCSSQKIGGLQFIINEVRRLLRDVSTFIHCVFHHAPDEESVSCVEDLLLVWSSLENETIRSDETLNTLDSIYPNLKLLLRLSLDPRVSDEKSRQLIQPISREEPDRPPCDNSDIEDEDKSKDKVQWKKVGRSKFLCLVRGCQSTVVHPTLISMRRHIYESHPQPLWKPNQTEIIENNLTQREDSDVNQDAKSPFSCEYCDAKFSTQKTLALHIRSKHAKKYECQLCGLKVGSPYQLERHHWTHNGEKPYHCDKCDYHSARKGNLDKHKGEKHGDFGDRNCFCEICGVPFQTPGSLKYHIQMKHLRRENQPVKEEKPFQCDRCEYKFSSKFHLNQHVYAKHDFDGIKKFCCELCGKSYKSGNTLKGHLRFVHWGEPRRKSSHKSSNKPKKQES